MFYHPPCASSILFRAAGWCRICPVRCSSFLRHGGRHSPEHRPGHRPAGQSSGIHRKHRVPGPVGREDDRQRTFAYRLISDIQSEEASYRVQSYFIAMDSHIYILHGLSSPDGSAHTAVLLGQP